MLRTAGAAGADGVLLGPGCVDAYNPKTVRGGMGAHLRLPIQTANWEQINAINSRNGRLAGGSGWGNELHGRFLDITLRPSSLAARRAALGSRRNKLATGPIAIPMHAATESLNAAVAAAVILFEAARQQANKELANPLFTQFTFLIASSTQSKSRSGMLVCCIINETAMAFLTSPFIMVTMNIDPAAI